MVTVALQLWNLSAVLTSRVKSEMLELCLDSANQNPQVLQHLMEN